MSSTRGSGNQEILRNIPEMKYVYVRRRRKAQELKEIENVPDNENHPPNETHPTSIQDGSRLANAPVAPLLTSLSNTQLLQYVEFMAAANIRLQEKEEAGTGTNTHRD